MDMTIDLQVALDEALIPHASRLRIGKSNFCLRSDITSKESTLQVVYDVLKLTLFFKAFLVTVDVPEIYMQEFCATTTVHHHSICFKMNNKKRIVNLEYFREMLHICPRIPNQPFYELPFEEEILAFLRNLGHSEEIKKITDVNINKLHQPWRSFAVVINKCMSGKSSGYDSLCLSQAQILWGMYHKKNIDFVYLLWEDFVYQVEHKDAKKSNKMYYPRFTKVIVNFFMTKDPSIPRRNKTSTKVEKPAKGKQPAKSSTAKGVPDVSTYESDEEISWKSSDEDDDDDVQQSKHGEDIDDQSDDESHNDQDDEDDDHTNSDNDGDDFVHPKFSTYDKEAKDEESFDPIVQTPSYVENSNDDGNDDVSHGMNVGVTKDRMQRLTIMNLDLLEVLDAFSIGALVDSGSFPARLLLDPADDQPVAEASHHPNWFPQQAKPPTLDRAWNTNLPATHGQNDIKWMDADDQAIQTILLGLPEDVYAAVDSCETAKEIWERVRQMMKENIAANIKFLNNLQPEWKRHVTIVHQTKNLHEADFTQIYDFLKRNQDEVNELRAKRLAKTHDPLALMAHTQNSYNFPATHNDQSSSSTHSQQSFPINNKYNLQPSLNQNFMQPPVTSLEDINDPTEAMNAALILFAKAFQLTAPTNNNQRTSYNPCNRQIAQPGMNMSQDRQIPFVRGNGRNQFGQYARQVAQNQQGYNTWQNGGIQVAQNAVQNAGVQNGIQLQAEEFDFMAVAGDLDEIKEVNANCILMANLQHASTSGTQLDKALVYDTDGSAEIQLNDNCYDNEIFNMFTQGEHANQKRHRTQVWKLKQVGFKERLACTPKPRLPRFSRCFKHMTENIKLLIKFVWKFLGTVCFGNDHIAAILGYGDLKWGNITITRVYFVEGTDLEKITKKWPKSDKIEHEIVKNVQKLDSKTFFCVQVKSQKSSQKSIENYKDLFCQFSKDMKDI
nr:integrase, catalytic region, zinc finger, CCHC-type, peptidase aspartic, catalytic [Tanacetum cinerariifolium]